MFSFNFFLRFFRGEGDPEFIKRQDQKRSDLDDQLKEYINEWRKQRAKEEDELKKLKEKQAKRKVTRAEEEQKMAQRKKEEEERRVREVEEKKQREIEEKRQRLEEAEKKRQAMLQAMKDKDKKGPNFTIAKKDQGVVIISIHRIAFYLWDFLFVYFFLLLFSPTTTNPWNLVLSFNFESNTTFFKISLKFSFKFRLPNYRLSKKKTFFNFF